MSRTLAAYNSTVSGKKQLQHKIYIFNFFQFFFPFYQCESIRFITKFFEHSAVVFTPQLHILQLSVKFMIFSQKKYVLSSVPVIKSFASYAYQDEINNERVNFKFFILFILILFSFLNEFNLLLMIFHIILFARALYNFGELIKNYS